MRIRVGDIVCINDLGSNLLLWSAPPLKKSKEAQVVSYLYANEVALVVGVITYDAKDIFVVAPQGCGWTFAALVKKLNA